jgi:hypothetical protein
VEALVDDAERLDLEGFQARYGIGFLLATATGPITARDDATNTELLLLAEDGERAAGGTAQLATVVFPVRPRDGSTGHVVTFGRDPQQDVVVPDPSVSRFHAFATRRPDGSFAVQDVGSTNGTTVNGHSVPQRGAGPPTALKPGDTLRLGQVELTFTDARALREFVRRAAGRR